MATTLIYPKCYICDQPLTDNEWDGESRSFFSAHFFECVAENPAGEWGIRCSTDGSLLRERYTHQRRAEHRAEHFTQWNPGQQYVAERVATI